MISKSSEVVFFMGAGASVAAGVPDTYSFVTAYLDSIKDEPKRQILEKIIETLKKWKEEKREETKIDIELLLETLTKLENKEQDPLVQFYPIKDFLLAGYDKKSPLIDSLKDFIKSQTIVSEEKIHYFKPLLALIEDARPLDIISVNYDTSVEQFCNVHKLIYQDGFDVHWNPKTFDKEHTDIRLYKLHGSIMWYQTDRGDYIKLPVMTEESKIQLITGEKAENLMLYPMQKWDYAEPFLELSVGIKRLLESEACKLLVVIGYSFRDEHIIRILWDSARKNRDLYVILIDPKAYKIYREKLQFYDKNNTNPSSLYGKVICLPYLFEKVLPSLKNYYLKNLKEGLFCETTQHQLEIQGKPSVWVSCLKQLIDAEYIEKAAQILKKAPLDETNFFLQSFEFPLRMGMNLSLGGEERRAKGYFENVDNHLIKALIEKIHIQVNIAQRREADDLPQFEFELAFNYQPRDGGRSYNTGKELIDFVETQVDYFQSRISFSLDNGENAKKFLKRLIDLKEYFKPFQNGKIEYERYIRLRKENISQIKGFIDVFSVLSAKSYPREELTLLAKKIEDIERGTLAKIFDVKIDYLFN